MGTTNFKSYNRVLKNCVILLITVLLGVVIYRCKRTKFESRYEAIPLATHSNGLHYVGSDTCVECHADIYKSHLETAHYLTSSVADTASVKGSFEVGNNCYFLNEEVQFLVTASDAALFQETRYRNTNEKISKHKLDIAIGSGGKGQSHLTWEKDKLYQLQVSYFSPTNSWTNSPGMSRELLTQLRPANAKCLECHTTFAKNTSLYGMGNSYDRNQILYGIDCERCHGPSMDHVVYHRNNPDSLEVKHMIKYDTLSRQQRLDACALCHSGVRSDIKPAFIFMTGDRLTDYSLPASRPANTAEIDVHGNQYELLRASKCFTETAMMDCTACHNPHKNQRGDTSYFNQKCAECHQEGLSHCKVEGAISEENGNNCIACHMPLLPSKSMAIQQEGDSLKTPVNVRTHLIKVYTEQIWNGK